MTVYGEMPWKHDDKDDALGVSFIECDRSKGVWACPAGRIEGLVVDTVRFSMLIERAARIFFNLTN